MKKLMIAAAIVCAAALSYGSAVQWSTGQLYGVDADGKWTSTTAQNAGGTWVVTAMLFDIEGNQLGVDSVKDSLSLGKASAYFTDKDKNNISVPNSTTDEASKVLVSLKMEYHNDEVFGAGKYAVFTSTDPVEYTMPGNGKGSPNFTTLGVIDTSKTQWTIQSVPEPTSGLLLLLGVAGLALRRRRA